ncbi:MAG TPA: family 20 glycosylhydrolase [Bryocella sp.]|nr:family 20 glycosylhydrolase [Bryocella sp.]
MLLVSMMKHVAAQVQFVNHLMPQPAELTVTQGELALHSTFAVEAPNHNDARLRGAIDRALRQIEREAGLRHAIDGVVPTTRLVIKVVGPGEAVQSVNEDESYSLVVTTAGAEIDAATDAGAMHGLETLVQLLQPTSGGYVIPAVTIHDTPRFRWRGLMIDCGRHFEPVDVIKRNLDGMAAVKLNVFHWHLTEDQGFRIQSKLYPRLTEHGSDGLFYTQEQAREIVAYARARGIRVVPEFEMPGHSTAWLVAYPELASGTKPAGIRRKFGVSPSALDPTRGETYVFIRRFLAEMSTIFPDAYVHIGGDETPAPDWKTNPRIVAFMKAHHLKDNEALQTYFNTRVVRILTAQHKHMMGWDEILTPGLPRNVVVQSWRGVASLSKGAKLGYDGVLSAPYYLDHMESAETLYLADPLPSSSDLTPAERSHVLGGEICMWGEHINARTIDSRIWPRAAAIAERFWSPESVRDSDSMYRRLETTSIELEDVGLTHLQSGEALLRELEGTEQIDTLRKFAAVLEPVSFQQRASTQHTDQATPLDNLVDAVRPDPPTRYWFEASMKRYLADPQHDEADQLALSSWFAQLTQSVPPLRSQLLASPSLREVLPRADQLLQLAAMGQQAVGYAARAQKVPTGWKSSQLQLLEQAQPANGLVRFVFLPSLKDLIESLREEVPSLGASSHGSDKV